MKSSVNDGFGMQIQLEHLINQNSRRVHLSNPKSKFCDGFKALFLPRSVRTLWIFSPNLSLSSFWVTRVPFCCNDRKRSRKMAFVVCHPPLFLWSFQTKNYRQFVGGTSKDQYSKSKSSTCLHSVKIHEFFCQANFTWNQWWPILSFEALPLDI